MTRTFRLAFLSAGVLLSAGVPTPARGGKSLEEPTPVEVKPRGKIGAVIGTGATGEVVVVQVLPGSPAAQAGLSAGDEILEVDGTKPKPLGLTEVVDRIGGPVGSQVQITLSRKGRRFVVSVIRGKVTPDSNDAQKDPRVRALVDRIVKAQGGARRILGVTSLSALWQGPGGSRHLVLSRAGLRSLTCPRSGPPEVFGWSAGQPWGGSRSSNEMEEARDLVAKPYWALENLRVVDFADPRRELRYLGAQALEGAPDRGGAARRLVERFEFEGARYDFEPASGRLVAFVDPHGVAATFGGWRTVKGLAVPGWRRSGSDLHRLTTISFAAIRASRLRPTSRPTCPLGSAP